MIGLIALCFVGLALWVAISGWQGFKAHPLNSEQQVSKIVTFIALSATLSAIVFAISIAAFSGQTLYIGSLAVSLVIINISALYLLSWPVRLIKSNGKLASDALRFGTAFFIVYWFTLAEMLMDLFNVGYYN